jgi:hypothetical protein
MESQIEFAFLSIDTSGTEAEQMSDGPSQTDDITTYLQQHRRQAPSRRTPAEDCLDSRPRFEQKINTLAEECVNRNSEFRAFGFLKGLPRCVIDADDDQNVCTLPIPQTKPVCNNFQKSLK